MKPMRLLKLLFIAWSLPVLAAEPLPMTFAMQVFPPFIIHENGQQSGFFPDTLRAVCTAMHASCTMEVYPQRRAYAMALGGGVDGILMLLNTPQRQVDLYMGPAIVQTAYALYAQQQNPVRYSVPADLAGYTVAAYGPSGTSYAAEGLVNRIPGARLEVEIDNPTALRKLRMGRYGPKAVVFINHDLALHLMKPEGDAGLKQVGELQKIEYHIGLSRKKLPQQQVDTFHATLQQLLRDGTIAAIAKKYGLKAVPSE
ncbi:ABC transporter substrate-binding protein [Pseudoduganella sp. LjRoot289]|uniref:substrate-binding periplasmic protein n=1 Tax=Pseudoduganella sp. LjRoot289 TaxID=3342314 RepID=UPI003ECEAFCD